MMLPEVGSVLTSGSNNRSVIAPETVSDCRIGFRMRTSVPTTLYTTWPRVAGAAAAAGAAVGFGCAAAGALVGAVVAAAAGALVGAAAGADVGAAGGGAAGPHASRTASGSVTQTRNNCVTCEYPR